MERLETQLPWEDVRTAADVDRMASLIYGSPTTDPGILHPTAVWQSGVQPDRQPLTTLEIRAETPKSDTDLFVLQLARARADAIITTGKILRSEPETTHALDGPADVASALKRWRRDRLGRSTPPISLVLTSGCDLDLEHPLLASGATRPLIFTSPDGRARLKDAPGVEIVAIDEPSIRRAIDFLRCERDARTISVEAGPSTSRELYDGARVVDELLLSTLHSPSIPKTIQGADFLTRARIERDFRRSAPAFRNRTDDGIWVFERFVR